MNYTNTNKSLYDDIALWEKTDGKDLFAQMPLAPDVKDVPTVLDFGYGFGENLFALSNAYPNGKSTVLIAARSVRKRLAKRLRHAVLKTSP